MEEIRNTIYQQYVTSKMKILGITYSFEDEDFQLNYVRIIKRMKNDIEIQKMRNLTCMAKYTY